MGGEAYSMLDDVGEQALTMGELAHEGNHQASNDSYKDDGQDRRTCSGE